MIKSKTMRRTVFVLIISALISCKNNSKENTSGVKESISTIEVVVSQNDLQIANKNGEPNYIFLEQRDKNSAIADISKLIYFDDKIIILDKQSNKVDRKSTRLNSSHVKISYAVFCLKKK